MLEKRKIEDFTDRFNMVHPRPVDPSTHEPSTLNGLSYTAAWIITRDYLDAFEVEYSDDTPGRIGNAERSRFITTVLRNRVPETGMMLARTPGHGDQQAWDDYTSVALAAFTLEIYGIGEKLWSEAHRYRAGLPWWWPFKTWWLNNAQFHKNGGDEWKLANGKVNWNAWLGRFPQTRYAFALSAEQKPSMMLTLAWGMGMMMAARAPLRGESGQPVNQTGFRMAWLQMAAIETASRRGIYATNWLERWFLNDFKKKLYSRIQDFSYTQEGYWEPGHPLLDLWSRVGPRGQR